MQKYQAGIIFTLLWISVVAAVGVPVLFYCIRKRAEKRSYSTYKKITVSRMLLLSGCILIAVWCLRYAVGYFSIISAVDKTGTLTCGEEIFNSMLHALQTFSLDEDYTQYILKGKAMLGAVLGADSGWIAVYGLYASVLNFAAPVAGGAILFDILASIFPKFRLYLSYFAKEKYYFSELNDASLALAKSIYDTNADVPKKPVIVFTDAYIDNKDEKSSENLLEAKALGAICLKEDLSHVKLSNYGMRTFFLIDKAESGNLATLARLANSDNRKYLKKSEMFFFTNDDAYVQVERSVRDGLKFDDDELPVFVPVKSYRNLISNLLTDDVPLYEPLIGKKRDGDGNQELSVTILGAGHIGTEMFLSAYWIGQILNCILKINVISQETEEEFWGRIDYVNPEIRHTTTKGHPILRINRKGDIADVYCEVTYHQCDVKSSEFISCLTDPGRHILDTDYFLVSLGSDQDNISVANTVRKYIGQYHISIKQPVKTVITYVVYDHELSETLNREKFYRFVNENVDVYMQAIGSLHDVYSVRNVYLTDRDPFAQKTYEAYAAIQNRTERAKTHRDRMKNDYKYWADLARGMHIQYKAYSMGIVTDSLFDYPGEAKLYNEKTAKFRDEYMKLVSGQFEFESEQQEAEHLTLLHRMAWLEHRRWNAFTRVKGFRNTTDYDVYAVSGVEGTYKQMDIKLHPCLVECDQKGIRATMSSKGVLDKKSLFQCADRDNFDLLDDLSYDLYRKKYNNFDFKEFDYPIFAK